MAGAWWFLSCSGHPAADGRAAAWHLGVPGCGPSPSAQPSPARAVCTPGPIGLGWEEVPVPGAEAEPSEEGWAVGQLSSRTDVPSASATLEVSSPGRSWGWSRKKRVGVSAAPASEVACPTAGAGVGLWPLPACSAPGGEEQATACPYAFPSVAFFLLPCLIYLICTCRVFPKTRGNILLVLREERKLKYLLILESQTPKFRGLGCQEGC